MFFHAIVEPRTPNERLSGALCTFDSTQEKSELDFVALDGEGWPITWRRRTVADGDLQSTNGACGADEARPPGHGQTSGARSNVDDKPAISARDVKRHDRARVCLLDEQTEADYLAGEDRLGLYLTLARGIAYEEEHIRSADFVLGVLDSRSS